MFPSRILMKKTSHFDIKWSERVSLVEINLMTREKIWTNIFVFMYSAKIHLSASFLVKIWCFSTIWRPIMIKLYQNIMFTSIFWWKTIRFWHKVGQNRQPRWKLGPEFGLTAKAWSAKSLYWLPLVWLVWISLFLHIKTKIVSCHTADSKPAKQEVNGTVILSPFSIPWLKFVHE